MRDNLNTTDKHVEGFDAFAEGKSLNDNPYGLFSGREDWNRGWLKARGLAVAEFKKKTKLTKII